MYHLSIYAFLTSPTFFPLTRLGLQSLNIGHFLHDQLPWLNTVRISLYTCSLDNGHINIANILFVVKIHVIFKFIR